VIANLLKTILLTLLCSAAVTQSAAAAENQTLVVTAEGLADPSSAAYSKDRAMMMDDLRLDAQRQAIEKAVGVYVESSTLVENYLLIEDRVLSRSSGLIKQILDQSEPRLGEDGLMHLTITAEVFISDVKQALDELSRTSRKRLIRSHGDPTISVAIVVKDARRGSDTLPENSPIAENILKEHFVNFGYRVWSEDYTKLLRSEAGARKTGRRVADFTVVGEVKFKQTSVTLKASGLKLTKHALTSWTVKCLNNHTGEEIYFNNKVPRKKAWGDEDQALEEIGSMIGQEFNKEFFEFELLKPSQLVEIQLSGVSDYDTALLFKNEFNGLRNILDTRIQNFDAAGLTIFEVECTGGGNNIAQLINNGVIRPLNKKLSNLALQLQSFHGNVVQIKATQTAPPEVIKQEFSAKPPASLVLASAERIEKIIKDPETLKLISEMNQ
jgi:hypothetical protein